MHKKGFERGANWEFKKFFEMGRSRKKSKKCSGFEPQTFGIGNDHSAFCRLFLNVLVMSNAVIKI